MDICCVRVRCQRDAVCVRCVLCGVVFVSCVYACVCLLHVLCMCVCVVCVCVCVCVCVTHQCCVVAAFSKYAQ